MTELRHICAEVNVSKAKIQLYQNFSSIFLKLFDSEDFQTSSVQKFAKCYFLIIYLRSLTHKTTEI